MKTGLTPVEKARERQMIQDPELWPGNVLHVKSPPWKQPFKGGLIFPDAPNTVYVKEEDKVAHYPTVDALLEDWIVD